MDLFQKKDETDGKLHSKKLYSRKDLKKVLSTIMQEIKNAYNIKSK